MDGTWWRRKEELDETQREFVMLPPTGRLLLKGPPGSGKTNLLLLRALFIAGAGEKNVLIITFTRTLADFIRTGIESEGVITADKVRTFHSWAAEHIREYTGERLVADGAEFDDSTRARALELLRAANGRVTTKSLYSAIFVDEAQDLSADELECLLELSEVVCVCGDVQQGIYEQDGLLISDRLGLDVYELEQHYRISQKIARVADPCPRHLGGLR
jgi:superfamily I DNA/RNA helicase